MRHDTHIPPTPDADGTEGLLRQIKQDLRGMMNGPVSQSMRQKGLRYKVNFGVELPRLQDYAAALPHTYALAAALWKEDIRECRLLAGMLMPRGEFPDDLADLWAEQMRFPEEADTTVFHLLQHLPYASGRAFMWMAAERPLLRYLGYALLTRLFMRGLRLTTRDAQEFLDHAAADLKAAGDANVRAAAYKALLRFMDFGIGEERMGQRVLSSVRAACRAKCGKGWEANSKTS
ncbi:MAG: DNA alkylation repair protein [Alloprevotella sp.]|nr:DNA alkylation repair protein [Alloprevotella sp.]